MPKTKRKKSSPRIKNPVTKFTKTAPVGEFKYQVLAAIFLILAAVAASVFFPLKPKASIKSANTAAPSAPPQSTQEAKLTQVYEKEKNIPLKNFTPRYSVYEDASVGFKLAYPVGFNVTTQDYGVKITPATGTGSIDVYVSNGNSKFQVNSAGANAKDTDVLNTAADFIRGTFQFTQPQTLDKNALQERFGGANTSSHY